MRRLFIAYRFISRLYFYLPFLVVLFIHNGLSYIEIGVLITAYSGVISFFGKKISILTRRFEYRSLIMYGELAKALGLVMLCLTDSFYLMLVAQVISGIGYIIANGSDSAILSKIMDATEYKEVESQSHFYVFLAVFIAGVIGGGLAYFNIKLPFVFSVFVCFLSSILATFFPKLNRKNDGLNVEKEKFNDFLIQDAAFKIAILNYKVIRGLMLAVYVAYLPILFFVKAKIPLFEFGLILGSYSIASMVATKYSIPLIKKIGSNNLYLFLSFITLISFLLIGLSSKIAIASVFVPFLIGIPSGMIRPATVAILSDKFKKGIESSVFVSAEAGVATVLIFTVLLGNMCISYFGMKAALHVLSGFGILAIFSLFILTKIFLYRKKANNQNEVLANEA